MYIHTISSLVEDIVCISNGLGFIGRTLEAPIPKMSGLVKKISPFSKRKNPL